MSSEAMAWAKVQEFDGKQDATLKSVLRALADYADMSGVCFPRYGSLVEDTDLARVTVIRAVARLVDLGLVEKRNIWVGQDRDWDAGEEQDATGKRQTSNVYRLRLEFGIQPKPRLPKSVTRGVCETPIKGGGVSQGHPRGVSAIPLEPSLEASASEKRPDDPQKAVWDRAVLCLTQQGGLSDPAARSFFGRLLKLSKLKASDLADVVENAISTSSADPRSYLRAAADAEAKRRGGDAPAVGQVAAWSEERWAIALDLAARRNLWPAEWGPRVGSAGCVVPEALWSRAVELGLSSTPA